MIIVSHVISDITPDPNQMEEPDPSKCNALESSLWELKVSNHGTVVMFYTFLHSIKFGAICALILYAKMSM